MQIKTFSIIAGSETCNASCPFCISKMTPLQGLTLQEPNVNWRNFKVACKLAKQSNTTTAMITGKGEPTLFPNQITKYLEALQDFNFPFIELQTNGILLLNENYSHHLKKWYELGLTVIAISIVHYEPEKNREIYLPNAKQYVDLLALIKLLHEIGFSVRLTSILAEGYIDNPTKVQKLIDFAKTNLVEQLTIRPITKPYFSREIAPEKWVGKNFLKSDSQKEIESYLSANGKKLMILGHGAVVYDVGGQNVCLNTCLTVDTKSDEIRQMIFFPDGHLRYDWQYRGAILL